MTRNFRLLIGAFVFVGLYCLGDTYASDQGMTPDAINQKLENNDLLKKLGKNGPLDDYERHTFIEKVSEYCNSSGGGIVNRKIAEFKGDTLLVGGGKKGGFSRSHPEGHNLGVTNIERYTKELEQIKSGTHPNYGGISGIRLDTPENKQKAIEELQAEIDKVLNQYYTVNFDKSTDPDLVASITSMNDLSTLPDHRFQTVIFENVDMHIWFCPSIFKILERIVKPGGKIVIQGAVQPRLLVIAFAPTKWANEVNSQLEKVIPSNDRSTITLTN